MPSVFFFFQGARDLTAPPGGVVGGAGAFAHVAEIENGYCQKHSWRVSGGGGVRFCVCLQGKGTGGGGAEECTVTCLEDF